MEKYQYQTRPDLSPSQKDYIGKSSDLTIKTWIANELARLVEINKVQAKIQAGTIKLSPETIKELREMIEKV